jgi:hypothetical protein
LALIDAVPFFLFFLIELTVILLAGEAAARHGRVPGIRKVGLGLLPLRLARPSGSFPPGLELPQKTNCEFTATPHGTFVDGVGLEMKDRFGVPPATGARAIESGGLGVALVTQ